MDDLYFRIYGDYHGAGPVFYPRQDCPWLPEVERHWRTVRAEFEEYHYRRRSPLQPTYVPDDVQIQGWRSVNLVTYRHFYRENCAAFPKTVQLLTAIPGLTSAFLNLLEPRSKLPVHNGDTNTTYRCHLPLIVPTGGIDKLGIEVGGERRGWREGEAFAFNEAFRHTVWNHTDHDRVVLVFDVLKPEYRDRTGAICGGVMAAMTLTMLETRIPSLRRLRPAGRRRVHQALSGVATALLLARGGLPPRGRRSRAAA